MPIQWLRNNSKTKSSPLCINNIREMLTHNLITTKSTDVAKITGILSISKDILLRCISKAVIHRSVLPVITFHVQGEQRALICVSARIP